MYTQQTMVTRVGVVHGLTMSILLEHVQNSHAVRKVVSHCWADIKESGWEFQNGV